MDYTVIKRYGKLGALTDMREVPACCAFFRKFLTL